MDLKVGRVTPCAPGPRMQRAARRGLRRPTLEKTIRFARPLVLLFIVVMLLRWFEYSQVYHPTHPWEATPADIGAPFEDVTFAASDGLKLSGWFMPAPTNSARRDWAVLACHGNGGNISHRVGLYQALLNMGFNVLAFDYRGYGRSAGRPNEAGTYRDAAAAWDWLRQKGFAANHIILHGESLGGGIASELALREPGAGGLILQSTFTSIPAIGAELFPWLPVRMLSTIKYDTKSKLPGIKVPLLVMHSRSDTLVRFHHSEENFAAANQPKVFQELRGDHNDPYWEDPGFKDGFGQLMKLVGRQR